MFTGIIQSVGIVHSVRMSEKMMHLAAHAPSLAEPGAMPRRGDSVAVSGCCLTLTADVGSDHLYQFDVISQTLAVTTLGRLAAGRKVNLELAVSAGTPLGGHIVQGHVDGLGRVVDVRTGEDWRIRIAPPAHMLAFFIDKGSVCVDGVSLTLAEVGPTTFDVALIPETLAKTTLAGLVAGDVVNLEADAMVKTIVRTVERVLALGGGAGGGRGAGLTAGLGAGTGAGPRTAGSDA